MKWFIVFIIIIASFSSCKEGNVYKYVATDTCSNLELYVSQLFPNEVLELSLNNVIIFRKKNESSLETRFRRKFCVPYTDTFSISVRTALNGKTYVDTTIIGYKHKWGYHVNMSLPHPYNWKEYYKGGVPVKKWGYLPIDSCIRFIALVSDSVYKNTMVCGTPDR